MRKWSSEERWCMKPQVIILSILLPLPETPPQPLHLHLHLRLPPPPPPPVNTTQPLSHTAHTTHPTHNSTSRIPYQIILSSNHPLRINLPATYLPHQRNYSLERTRYVSGRRGVRYWKKYREGFRALLV